MPRVGGKRYRPCLAIIAALLTLRASASGQEEIVLDKRGGIEVIMVPQPSPAEDLIAGKIVLRSDTSAVPPYGDIITFEALAIRGNVHQVFLPDSLSNPMATPHVDTWEGVESDLIRWDTHLLIAPGMVGGGAGGGFSGITETPVDGTSFPAPFESPFMAFGDLHVSAPTDAFYLSDPFQSTEVELAYIVASNDFESYGETLLAMGVLVEHDINCACVFPDSWWGIPDDPLVVFPLIPEPSTWFMGCLMCVCFLAVFRGGNHLLRG